MNEFRASAGPHDIIYLIGKIKIREPRGREGREDG